MRKARFEAGQAHVKAGQKLRMEGKLEEAVQEFQKALVADPSSAIAMQEMKRIQTMLAAPKTGARVEDRGLTPAELVRRQSQDKVDSMVGPPELKPMTAIIPVLKMNNQPPKVLYETVAKLAGVNVVFDSQYAAPARNFNVDLSNATADQAFDYLATLTHTFWKAITPNTIFVAEDNVTKRRDYEDEVVKVFYVTNATSVQEFQEIATAIRTVAEIRRVFTYNAQRAMIVRDTVDKVALAEKLVHDLDKPKSEVVVDVMVMQVNSERTRDLAATIASAGTAGLNVPINFAPAGTHDYHHYRHDRHYFDADHDDYGQHCYAGATGAPLDHRFFDHAAGRAAAGDAERQPDEGVEQSAGAGVGRAEGDAEDRQPHSVCDGQFPDRTRRRRWCRRNSITPMWASTSI